MMKQYRVQAKGHGEIYADIRLIPFVEMAKAEAQKLHEKLPTAEIKVLESENGTWDECWVIEPEVGKITHYSEEQGDSR